MNKKLENALCKIADMVNDGKLERAYIDFEKFYEIGDYAIKQEKLTDRDFRFLCKILSEDEYASIGNLAFCIADYEIGIRVILQKGHGQSFNMKDTKHIRFARGPVWDCPACYSYLIDYTEMSSDGITLNGVKCKTLKSFLEETKKYLEDRTGFDEH